MGPVSYRVVLAGYIGPGTFMRKTLQECKRPTWTQLPQLYLILLYFFKNPICNFVFSQFSCLTMLCFHNLVYLSVCIFTMLYFHNFLLSQLGILTILYFHNLIFLHFLLLVFLLLRHNFVIKKKKLFNAAFFYTLGFFLLSFVMTLFLLSMYIHNI